LPHHQDVRQVVLGIAALVSASTQALTVSGYTTAANNRFSSGFSSVPIDNASGSFVGTGYDWSAVGWDSATPTKGFGLISSRHYLVARHFGGATSISFTDGAGTVASASQASVVNTDTGLLFNGQTVRDLSIGRLTAPLDLAWTAPRLAVLDLNSSSTTNNLAAYTGLQVFLYGRGPTGADSPRIASTTILGAGNDASGQYFVTGQTAATFQSGDSGSPSFHGWTNPNGGKELALVGNNAALDTTNGYNIVNFLGLSTVMAAVNNVMGDDGFALRVAGNVSNTWVGSSSTDIGNRGAWGLNPPTSAPSDRYVLFNAATAGNSRAVTVSSAAELRGLYFKSTVTTGDAFAFTGAGVLTIGRGGLVNYDEARQSFANSLRLGDAQYWDAGAGGFSVAGIDTNGKVLEIGGSGRTLLNGQVTGTGKLAVSSGRLDLLSANSHSGGTFLHGGELRLGDGTAAGTGTLTLAGGKLASSSTASRSITNALSINGHSLTLGDAVDNGALTFGGAVALGTSVRTLVTLADVTFNGRLSGIGGGIRKQGEGTLVLSDANTYSGASFIEAGNLAVNGSIASSAVSISSGASLSGRGTVGAISGAGTINPGNSPGILTATSFDPTGGLDLSLEFTQLGNPTWGSAGASGNDVLRLTAATPFLANLTAANTLSLYLDLGTLVSGMSFRGGIFTDANQDFLQSVAGATYAFHVRDDNGSINYNGQLYRAYDGQLTFELSTVGLVAGFTGGAEDGYVMQFTAIPEPSTMGWGLGALALALTAARRRLRP